ncbi:MAG: aminopeptidase P family N-terminal domain-containing protein, partial [Caldimicrobium sp.]
MANFICVPQTLELIQRWENVKNLLHTYRVDALLFTSASNIYYLTRFRASQAYLLVTKDNSFLFTDARYYEKAKNLNLPFLEIKLLIKEAFKELKSHFKSLNLKVIGFEKDRTTCEFIEKIRSKDYKLLGVSQPLKNLRLIKSLSEIENLKRSVEITDRIFKELLSFILPG